MKKVMYEFVLFMFTFNRFHQQGPYVIPISLLMGSWCVLWQTRTSGFRALLKSVTFIASQVTSVVIICVRRPECSSAAQEKKHMTGLIFPNVGFIHVFIKSIKSPLAEFKKYVMQLGFHLQWAHTYGSFHFCRSKPWFSFWWLHLPFVANSEI